MILSSSVDQNQHLQGSLEQFFEAYQMSSL